MLITINVGKYYSEILMGRVPIPTADDQMYTNVYTALTVWVLRTVYSAITQIIRRNSGGEEEQLKTGQA